jgi:uncharacterized protein (TIGR04255 family)
MTDRGGILPNSPLQYTLASVRFAPLPLLPSKIPEIHNELREVTPLLQHVQQQIQLTPQGPGPTVEHSTQAWLIMASDRSFGVQLGTEQVLFFAKKYTRFAEFHSYISKGLRILYDHMKFLDVIGTGVRYVDRVTPRGEETLSQYIAEHFLTPPVASFDAIGGSSQYVYEANGTQLRVRSIFSSEALSIPMDLIGLLATIQGPDSPLILNKLGANEMLLDMDSVANSPQPKRSTLDEVTARLDMLHKQANAFFRHPSVCTDFAFQVWRGER